MPLPNPGQKQRAAQQPEPFETGTPPSSAMFLVIPSLPLCRLKQPGTDMPPFLRCRFLQISEILGALTLYAEKSGAFGTEEVRLLTELADDLAYGINAIRYSGQKKAHHQPLS